MCSYSTFRPDFLKDKAGLRCIGDVHGDPMFRHHVEDARAQNLAILSLGDLTDRGPDSPDAIRVLIDLIDTGDGDVVPGNHDWRYYRLLKGRNVKTSNGLEITLAQMAEAEDRQTLEERYVEIIGASSMWHRHGGYVFAHGGISGSMLDADPPTMATPGADKTGAFNRAIYGQSDGTKNAKGYPNRIYDWVDRLPEGTIAIIGHDNRHHIETKMGALGGKALLIDTGAGKGGHLSYYDIPIDLLTPA